MRVEVVNDYQGFTALRDEWERLTEASPAAPLFSSFDFVDATWQHLRKAGERLFVLCLRKEGALAAVAPFSVISRTAHRIPLRVIRFITADEGDSPAVLSTAPEDEVWQAISTFLRSEFRSWDLLELVEQPDTSIVHSADWPFNKSGFQCRRSPDHISYAISLRSSWDDYLAALHKQVRKNWAARRRKFEAECGGVRIDSFNRPDDLPHALGRFIAVEEASWKKDALTGTRRSPAHAAFFQDLLGRLISKGALTIHLLRAQEGDAAGLLMMRFKDKLVSLQIAYNESYARYSPAILLRMEVLRPYFGTGVTECDLLGLHPSAGPQQHKQDWATDTRRALRVTVYKRRSRAAPLLFAARIKGLLKNSTTAEQSQ